MREIHKMSSTHLLKAYRKGEGYLRRYHAFETLQLAS